MPVISMKTIPEIGNRVKFASLFLFGLLSFSFLPSVSPPYLTFWAGTEEKSQLEALGSFSQLQLF